MDSIEVAEKIEHVMEAFGMSGKKAAEAIGMTYGGFRKRLSKEKGQYFQEAHYEKLVEYILDKAKELKNF